ncbi:MAG: hypothetical protein KGO02_14260 [Alphaproteobacteria bacterium]|nr:hypothetical protein [Alphaproteobacteria bacterium]
MTGLIWAWAIMVFGSIGLGLYAVWALDLGKARRNGVAVDANIAALNRAADTADLRREMAQMRSQLAVVKVLLLLALLIIASLLIKVYGVHL